MAGCAIDVLVHFLYAFILLFNFGAHQGTNMTPVVQGIYR